MASLLKSVPFVAVPNFRPISSIFYYWGRSYAHDEGRGKKNHFNLPAFEQSRHLGRRRVAFTSKHVR